MGQKYGSILLDEKPTKQKNKQANKQKTNNTNNTNKKKKTYKRSG